MDERWKALPRERIAESVAARKRHLPRQREQLQQTEVDIAWFQKHSFDGPLEGDEEAAACYRRVIQQCEERIAAMEAFLSGDQ